jgi:hypothetical protein
MMYGRSSWSTPPARWPGFSSAATALSESWGEPFAGPARGLRLPATLLQALLAGPDFCSFVCKGPAQ